jgi:hypothetical protein
MSNWYKTAQSGFQKSWTDDIGDIQRYIFDNYQCRVFLTKTAQMISISISLNHQAFGHVMWQDFWRFPHNLEDKAKEIFNDVKVVTSKIFNDFRSNLIPNPMLHSYLREAVRHIGEEYKPTSRIPFVDWAKQHDGVSDWRSSIYGTRYPKNIDGF